VTVDEIDRMDGSKDDIFLLSCGPVGDLYVEPKDSRRRGLVTRVGG
jgi:hypothetical protein